MFETFTKTAGDIATDVREKFGDTGSVQLTDSMLLRWINNGQREIAGNNPIIEKVAATNLLAGIGVYDLGVLFSDQKMRSISQIVVGGSVAKMLRFAEFATAMQNEAVDTGGAPYAAALYGDSLSIYPIPAETVAAGIAIYFTAYPAELEALTDPLGVPDRYVPALSDLVLTNALELDENYDAAQVKLGHYQERARAQSERTDESPDAYYPVITDMTYEEYA